MYNPFREEQHTDINDLELIERILEGESSALEKLILRHQQWIYNIALRMVWEPADAEDVTQEILIKMVTALSGFRKQSSFRTWLFTLVKNHTLNMKRRPMEHSFTDFSDFAKELEQLEDLDPPDPASLPVELPLIIEETQVGCMSGMLLCMDREQRLITLLGNIFGVSDAVGAEVFGISRENYRQKLSRARKQLTGFMNDECGLINTKNPCRCEKKTRASIKAGYVDPHNLRFVDTHLHRVKEVAGERTNRWDDWLEKAYMDLYRDQPYLEGPDFVGRIREIISTGELKDMFEV